jgi:hypothetical protein
MFTKQHYEAIAHIIDSQTYIKSPGPDHADWEVGTALDKVGLINALVALFEKDNKLFQANKFIKACK